jgi:hypothetical protein
LHGEQSHLASQRVFEEYVGYGIFRLQIMNASNWIGRVQCLARFPLPANSFNGASGHDSDGRWIAIVRFAQAGAFGRSGIGPGCVRNAKTLNRDRTSYSFEIVLGAQIASPFSFEDGLKNIILVALRVFEFSHSLGPSAKWRQRSLRSA